MGVGDVQFDALVTYARNVNETLIEIAGLLESNLEMSKKILEKIEEKGEQT